MLKRHGFESESSRPEFRHDQKVLIEIKTTRKKESRFFRQIKQRWRLEVSLFAGRESPSFIRGSEAPVNLAISANLSE